MDAETTNAAPKRNRRWYQFSLRGLMFVTLVVAIACAWIGQRITQKRRQHEAAITLVKLGDHAQAAYDYQRDGANSPPGPAWARWLLGDDFFCEVFGAQFESVQDADRAAAGLKCISEFYGLDALTLFSTRVSDESAENLSHLTKMRFLNLDKTGLTDNGSACLHGMIKLEELSLWCTNLTDEGLANLAGMLELRELTLSGTKVGDAGMQHLSGLHKLKVLRLCWTNVTDSGLVHLKGLTELVQLDLNDTRVTRAGVAELKSVLPHCEINGVR